MATTHNERGFAAMDPERQREIASMGGRAAHERGTAHEWDSDEAAEAGHRGGMARSSRGDSQSQRDETREVARKASLGGRGRDTDEEDEQRYESPSRRGSSYDDEEEDDNRSSKRGEGRGSASTDPERPREIARNRHSY